MWGPLLVESQKTLFFSCLFFARASDFSPQLCPNNVACIANFALCTADSRLFSSDFCWVVGCSESHVSPKKIPSQPKLCEVPRSWNHKKHYFFLFFFARASNVAPHFWPKNIVCVATTPLCTADMCFFLPSSLHVLSLSWRPLFWLVRMFHTF